MSKRTMLSMLADVTIKTAFSISLPAPIATFAGEVMNEIAPKDKIGDAYFGKNFKRIVADNTKQMLAQLEDFVEFELKVNEYDRDAAIEVVTSTISGIKFNYASIERSNFDPVEFSRLNYHFCEKALTEERISESGIGFGKRLFELTIRQIMSITEALPEFQHQMALETYLSSKNNAEKIALKLQEIIVPSHRVGNTEELDRFDAKYKNLIIQRISKLQQFGLDGVAPALRWQPLEATYISLSSTKRLDGNDLTKLGHGSNGINTKLNALSKGSANTVEKTIRDCGQLNTEGGIRLAISGQAGSGKTTVMKWIALCCAKGDKSVIDLGKINSSFPFLVSLSQAIPIDKNISPSLNYLNSFISPEKTPANWLDSRLSEKSIILFDGLDELLPEKQIIAKEWIRNIASEFPKCSIIISARPEAIDSYFLGELGFSYVSIRNMSPEQSLSCIDRWFDAQCSSATPSQANIYRKREIALKDHLSSDLNLRDLTESPLLTAMLCAYYANGSLANDGNRIKLVKNVIQVLIDGRDRERDVIPQELKQFTVDRKLEQLSKIAHFLFVNSARIATLDLSIGSCVLNVGSESLQLKAPGPSLDLSRSTKYLLERSAILIQVSDRSASFVHALFLENLTGYYFANYELGDSLIDSHLLPGWYSVAPFYCDYSTGNQANIFIRNVAERILDFIENESLRRRLTYCLVECVSASHRYDERLLDFVRHELSTCLPPKDDEEVKLLSSIGSSALLMLPPPESLEELASHIATARRVRGEEAMEFLSDLASRNPKKELVPLLFESWIDFDAASFAQKVLGLLDFTGYTAVVKISECARQISHCRNLRNLTLGPCEGIESIGEIPGLDSVTTLDMSAMTSLKNLDGISRFHSLRTLWLPKFKELYTIEPLKHLEDLSELFLLDGHRLQSLDPVSRHSSLRSISINYPSSEILDDLRVGFEHLERFSCFNYSGTLKFLAGLPNLRILRILSNDHVLEHVSAISNMRFLTLLDLSGQIRNDPLILPLSSQISRLKLSGSILVDYDSFQSQENLVTCAFDGRIDFYEISEDQRFTIRHLADLSHFSNNSRLKKLSITNNLSVYSCKGVDENRKLIELILDDCSEIFQVSWLNDMPQLMKISLNGNVDASVVDEIIARKGLVIDYDVNHPSWSQETG